MTRVVYVGMDVHKDTYSLCAFDAQSQCFLTETTIKAEMAHVLKYIRSIEIHFKNDELDVICGYEAGPTGFSLCRDLQKAHFSCERVWSIPLEVGPSTGPSSFSPG